MSSKNKTVFLASQSHMVFVALLALSFLFWFLYRLLFNFPVFFDETFGKAIFFGLPVIIYANATKKNWIFQSIQLSNLFTGLLRGLAFGGILGFFSLFVVSIQKHSAFSPSPVFMADQFLPELFFASLTAFWESLFFFGFIQAVLSKLIFPEKQGKVILFSSFLFLIFHLPNIMLRFAGLDVTFLIALLFLFGFGQSVLFNHEKNIYPLIVTHTIWGMILLIHF